MQDRATMGRDAMKITLRNDQPLLLSAGAGHQYLPHAVELALRFAEIPGGLSAPAGEALAVVPAQIRAHCRLLARPLVRWLVVLAPVHGISGCVLLVRPVEVPADVLGIDPAGYRRRGWRRRSVPLAAGNDLQLRPTAATAVAGLRRLGAAHRQPLHLPALLATAGGRHRHHFLACNSERSMTPIS